MKNSRILGYFLLFFVFLVSPLRAEPLLPHLFSDHMVIQRETEIRIWGWADAGEKISYSRSCPTFFTWEELRDSPTEFRALLTALTILLTVLGRAKAICSMPMFIAASKRQRTTLMRWWLIQSWWLRVKEQWGYSL